MVATKISKTIQEAAVLYYNDFIAYHTNGLEKLYNTQYLWDNLAKGKRNSKKILKFREQMVNAYKLREKLNEESGYKELPLYCEAQNLEAVKIKDLLLNLVIPNLERDDRKKLSKFNDLSFEFRGLDSLEEVISKVFKDMI